MLLSIGMMVKNEEKYLDECLKSLMPILENLDSELIIVDTGSTDNTVEIAKKYTDKVYFHNWNNNFSEMRNITLSYCTGEWFFYVDGDEVISECHDIIDFFKLKQYKNYNSATIYIKNLIDLNDETKYSIFPALRLFKKEKDFKFINAVHNQPLFKQPIKTLSVACKHYGYIPTDKELMEKKYNRTATILKNELKKDPNNIYYLYQLSVSYGMHKDYMEALNFIQKAYDCIIKKKDPNNIVKNMYVFPQLCSCYFNIRDYLNVEKYAKETLKYDKNLIDIYYYLGVASMVLKKDSQAISSFELYLKLYENYYNNEKNIDIVDYTLDRVNEVYYMLFVLNKQIKDCDKAQRYLLSITDNSYDVPANMVDLYMNFKEYSKIKSYEEALIAKNKLDDLQKLYNALENTKMEASHEEANILTKIFSLGNEPYNKLNHIRLSFKNEKTVDVNAINSMVEKIDLSSKEFYYGDLIYYMIYNKQDLLGSLKNLSFEKINEYLEYSAKKYETFNECVYAYILKFKNKNDFNSVRINKELCRYLIILDKLEKDKLENIYDYYLKVGTNYIKLVYSDFVLENEFWQAARTEEDRFYIYINKAKKYEESDKKCYVQFLKNALDAYPYMKDLIQYLLNKVKQQTLGINSEFENYKIKVKQNIKKLVDNESFDEALNIIREYEKIVTDDAEIYSIKGCIFIAKGKFIEAEEALKKGLNIDNYNFDLNYNLGYLYCNIINEYELSIEYYKRAINATENETIISEINLAISTVLDKLNLLTDEKYLEDDINIINYIKLGQYNELTNYLFELLKQMKFKYVLNVCNYIIINVRFSISTIYLLKGIAYNGLKDYKLAEKYHKIAISLDKNLCDIVGDEKQFGINYEEEMTSCIGCGSEDYSTINVSNQSLGESNKGIINPIRIWVQCKKCGLIYANPIPSEEAMNRYYSLIAKEKFGGIYGNIKDREGFLFSMANDRLNKINTYVKDGKILDIGTGIGIFVKAALDRGIEAYGLELTQEDCKYAKANYGLELIKKNFYDFDKDHLYDVVTMFEVIEHLRHPQKDLMRINKIVKKDGMLVIATPILDSDYGKETKENNVFWNVVSHLSYFTKDILTKYLKNAGFKVMDIKDSLEGMGRMEFYCRKITEV